MAELPTTTKPATGRKPHKEEKRLRWQPLFSFLAEQVCSLRYLNRTLSRMSPNALLYSLNSLAGAVQTKYTRPSGRTTVIIQSISWPPTGESLLRYVDNPGWPFRRTRDDCRVTFMFGFDCWRPEISCCVAVSSAVGASALCSGEVPTVTP